MIWHVVVSAHALDRALERFELYPGSVRTEVQEALQAGRVGVEPPAGHTKNGHTGLFAWTTDAARVYVIEAEADAFVVVTCLEPRADEPAALLQPTR